MEDRIDAGEILSAVGVIEAEISDYSTKASLAHLATASASGYLDFRLPELDWRAH